MIRVFVILLLLSGCSQKQVTSHMGATAGAVSGFATCRSLLNSGMELTAACAVVCAWIGASMFYYDDMNLSDYNFVYGKNIPPDGVNNFNQIELTNILYKKEIDILKTVKAKTWTFVGGKKHKE